jgi:hypothetical protein
MEEKGPLDNGQSNPHKGVAQAHDVQTARGQLLVTSGRVDSRVGDPGTTHDGLLGSHGGHALVYLAHDGVSFRW